MKQGKAQDMLSAWICIKSSLWEEKRRKKRRKWICSQKQLSLTFLTKLTLGVILYFIHMIWFIHHKSPFQMYTSHTRRHWITCYRLQRWAKGLGRRLIGKSVSCQAPWPGSDIWVPRGDGRREIAPASTSQLTSETKQINVKIKPKTKPKKTAAPNKCENSNSQLPDSCLHPLP